MTVVLIYKEALTLLEASSQFTVKHKRLIFQSNTKDIKKEKLCSEMISTRFSRLVLGLIFVSLAIKFYLACAQKEISRKGNCYVAHDALQDHASSQDGPNDHTSGAMAAQVAGLKRLSARKVKMGELLRKEIKENQVSSSQMLDLSGKGDSNTYSKGGAAAAAEHLKDQISIRTYQRLKQNKLGSNSVFDEKQPRGNARDDSKASQEKDDEVAHLMRGDYGYKHPRKKTPIHNREPTH